MHRTRRSLALACLSALALTAAPAAAFWSNDVSVNTAVCALPSTQFDPRVVPDAAGGVFIVWWDNRAGGSDYNIWGQHYDALGTALWAADGKLLVGGPGIEGAPEAIPDGAGGMLMVYAHAPAGSPGTVVDLQAQRFDPSGNALWPAAGVTLLPAPQEVYDFTLCSDGALGLIVAWTDTRVPANRNLFAQRVRANGTTFWTAGGKLIGGAAGSEIGPKAVADGTDGAYIVWEDNRAADTDIYVEHLAFDGTARYGSNGLAVCTATGFQSGIDAIADGQAGVIAAWGDGRVPQWDLYAQRITPSGAAWTANGAVVAATTGYQTSPSMVYDGDGGAFVTWTDSRTSTGAVFAQRMSRYGIPLWAANGVPLSVGIGAQSPIAVSDGAGGFIAVFQDFRHASPSLYAQRMNSNGVPQWTSNGVPVTTAPDDQNYFAAASDGAGSAIVTWEDFRRNGSDRDIYAERVERFGFAGTPEPVIASALDVPNDQGGKVKVSWYGSWPELPPTNAIDYFNVFRSVPTGPANKAIADGRRVVTPETGCESGDCLMALTVNGTTSFWEFVARQDGFDLSGYSYLVPTTGDSVGGSNPLTEFMVQARSSSGPQYWNSPVASGYSVDDLAPATPAPFTGVYASGTANLIWGANTEADLAGYELHRGTSAAFVPSPANRVTTTTETEFADAAGVPSYYKLAAIDTHGNRSGYALVVPSGVLNTPGPSLPLELALAPVSPNPVRGAAAFRFALPRGGSVQLSIFDTQGRLVSRVADSERPAGEHVVNWNGRDAGGRSLPGGLYMVRLRAGGRNLVERFVMLE